MKKMFLVLAFFALQVLAAAPAFALATGSGSIDFSFTGALPDLIQVNGNIYVKDNPGSYTSDQSSDDVVADSVTNGNATASYALGGPAEYMLINTIPPAYWKDMYWKTQYWNNPEDYSLSTTSFALSAGVPVSLTSVMAQAGTSGYFLYGGGWYGSDITTLPGFSYTYHFEGQADTTDDRLTFVAQIGVENFINGDSSHPRTELYTDYSHVYSGFPYYEYNPFYSNTNAQIVDPNFSVTGTRSFGPYSESVPHTWTIRWDFGGAVEDFSTGEPVGTDPGQGTVPEPASLVLLGLGLGGYLSRRKRIA